MGAFGSFRATARAFSRFKTRALKSWLSLQRPGPKRARTELPVLPATSLKGLQSALQYAVYYKILYDDHYKNMWRAGSGHEPRR